MKQVILASASPRRKQILGEILSDFLVIPSQKPEEKREIPPKELVAELARSKAEEVFSSHKDSLVIGADTVVVFENTILGKPTSKEDAKKTLKMLSGKWHSVLTGVCFIKEGKSKVDVVESKVLFKALSDEFIADYVASGSPMDKAGSYGIQDADVAERFEGSYTNIVGLPLERVEELLKEFLSE